MKTTVHGEGYFENGPSPDWGPEYDQLPVYTKDEVIELVKECAPAYDTESRNTAVQLHQEEAGMVRQGIVGSSRIAVLWKPLQTSSSSDE